MAPILVSLPLEFDEVVQIIKKQDWILTDFPISNEELYNPAGYLYNTKLCGVKYYILLDRNIFRFIVSSIKKDKPSEKNRAAIALVHFCQAADILFEPNVSVYERLLPQRNNTELAIDELFTFYSIDNADSESLLDYAIGRADHIEVNQRSKRKKDVLHDCMIEYQWLVDWKSLYVILLHIVIFDKMEIRGYDKMVRFMTWLVCEFRLSLPCIVFAVLLYSSRRIKGMNKLKNKDDQEVKINKLYNMTWDLYLINSFLQTLGKKKEDAEYLIATDDKVVKSVFRDALGVQGYGGFDYLKTLLPENEHGLVDVIDETIASVKVRVYDTECWTPDYREELIARAEAELCK